MTSEQNGSSLSKARGKRRPARSKLENKDSYEPLGELLGDRYLVISKIGRGTFANVYCARDLAISSSSGSSDRSSSSSSSWSAPSACYVAVKFQNVDATSMASAAIPQLAALRCICVLQETVRASGFILPDAFGPIFCPCPDARG